MILGAACLAVANAAILLGAHAVLVRVRVADRAVNVALLLLLRLFLISVVVLLCGATGFLAPLPIALLSVFALVLLAAFGCHRGVQVPFPDVHPALGVFLAIVLARLLAQVWFFSPYSGDALSYHLPKIAEWTRAGGFTREMGLDTHVTFPAGFELIETWWVLFLRHDVLIEMAGIEFLLLAFASTYALASRLGLNHNFALFAATLYGLTPGLHFQSTACVNDAPVAALYVATMTLVASNSSIALTLLPVGLGIGIKPTFCYALVGIILVWWLARRAKEERSASTRATWLLSGLSLAAGAFWFARNLLWYGNPIHPVGAQGLKGSNPIQFGFRSGSLAGNLGDLVGHRIQDASAPYGPYVNDISGWGTAIVACGIIAFLLSMGSSAAFRRVAAGFVGSLVVVLALVIHDPWSMRFVLFFPAILAIATARMASESRGILGIAVAGLGLQFVATALPKELPREVFHELARQGWRERSMAKLYQLDVPSDSIGYFADSRNVAYLWYRPDFSRRLVYLRAETADELRAQLKKANAGFVYAAPAHSNHYAVVQECESRSWLRRLRGFVYAVD